jgi:tetratricopeptide (TPR) repeat protein
MKPFASSKLVDPTTTNNIVIRCLLSRRRWIFFFAGTVVSVLVLLPVICAQQDFAVKEHSQLRALLQIDIRDDFTLKSNAEWVINNCSRFLAISGKLTESELFELYLRRAVAYSHLEKDEEALGDIRELLRLRPNDVGGRLLLASTLANLGKDQEALKEYKALIELNPNSSVGHSNLALYYLNVDDLENSLEYSNKAIGLDSNDSESYCLRGAALIKLGKLKDGLEDLNKCISMGGFGPGTKKAAHPYLWRSFVFIEGFGRPSQGFEDLLRALRLDPSSLQARVALWSYYFTTGRYHIANQMSEELAQEKLYVDQAEALKCRVSSLIASGQLEKAERIAEIAVAIPTDDQKAIGLVARANVYFAMAKYKESLRDYDEAASIENHEFWSKPSKTYLLAACPNEKFRDGKTAVKLASRCCQKTGMENARYLMLMAIAHAECGDFTQAVSLAKKSIEKADPSFPWLDDYKKRLKLFEEKKPFRFDPASKIFDYIY